MRFTFSCRKRRYKHGKTDWVRNWEKDNSNCWNIFQRKPKSWSPSSIADPEYFSQRHRFADPRQNSESGLRNEAPEFVPGFNRHFWFKIYIKRWKKFVLEPICSAVRVTSINWNYSRKLLHVQKYQTFQIRVVGLFYAMCVVLNANILNCLLLTCGQPGSCGMDHEVHFI